MDNTSLIFYSDCENEFTSNIRCCILKFGISFDESDNLNEIISSIQSHSVYAIMCVKSEFSNKLIDKSCAEHSNYFIKIVNNSSSSNYNEIVSSFISSLANKSIPLTPKPIPFAVQIVNSELEKLNLSKKYIGFKYISDIVIEAIKRNINDVYTPSLFQRVAILNNVAEDSVERDIRHILMKTWRNCPQFKQNLSNINKPKVKAHDILNAIVEYIHNII